MSWRSLVVSVAIVWTCMFVAVIAVMIRTVRRWDAEAAEDWAEADVIDDAERIVRLADWNRP